MFIDFVPLTDTYDEAVSVFLWNLSKAVVFIGENNLSLYNKFFRLHNQIADADQLSWGQKRKLGIAIVQKALKKKYSKCKIKQCLYLHNVFTKDNKIKISILPCSKIFRKVLDVILENLNGDQIAKLKDNHFSLLPYEKRINHNIIFLAPVQCDMIIAAAGRFNKLFEKKGQYLVTQIREA